MQLEIRINYKELAMGAIFGGALGAFTGLGAGITGAIVCAGLWAWGGSGAGRVWRYAAVPIVALLALSLTRVQMHAIHAIVATLIAAIVLAQGYGIPSSTPPEPDPGSPLGRLFFDLVEKGKSEKVAQDIASLLTRGTLALLLGLAYLPLAWTNAQNYATFLGVLVFGHLLATRFVEGAFDL